MKTGVSRHVSCYFHSQHKQASQSFILANLSNIQANWSNIQFNQSDIQANRGADSHCD